MKPVFLLCLLFFCLGFLVNNLFLFNIKMTTNDVKDLYEIMKNVSSYEYIGNNTFDCSNFSELFVKKMKEKGYYAEVIVGKTPFVEKDKYHAWVSIWIKPQAGRIVRIDDNFKKDENLTKIYQNK